MLFFCLFQCFEGKGYQTESKRNETFGNAIFGTNVIQRTWSLRKAINEEGTRQGVRLPPGRALHPRGPLVAPPTYFFLLYIPIYPGNIIYGAKTLFPPPQPSVPVRSHLGAFSGTPPEGALITEGLCRCRNRRISGRGSRTVRLRRMVTGGRGHDVYLGSGPLDGGNTPIKRART